MEYPRLLPEKRESTLEMKGIVLAKQARSPALTPTLANEEPLEMLVAAHQTRVARLAQRLLGWQGEVEDIVQEVFLAALSQRGKFRGEASEWTWLASITINKCRKGFRRGALLKKIGLGGWLGTNSSAPAADQDSILGEVKARVRERIVALPEAEREAVVLFYMEQFSISEIARIAGSNANAITVRLHRAREKLRLELSDLAEE